VSILLMSIKSALLTWLVSGRPRALRITSNRDASRA
jgi:hypothetical protein